MSTKYLDSAGLAYLWGKIKAYVDAHSGGGASVLDYYPVGSYYETSDTAFNPNTAWGGTWSLETAGQVHVSAGTGYAVSGALTDTTDGGSADAIIPYHSHSVNAVDTGTQSASHTHGTGDSAHTYFATSSAANTNEPGGGISGSGQKYPYVSSSYEWSERTATGNQSASHKHTLPAHNTNYAGTDGNTVGANMQPYIIVNRWHRTA